MMVDIITQRIFYEFVNDLKTGDEFTVYDVMDYIRNRAPRHTPNGVTIGHLAKQHPRVYRIENTARRNIAYGVI